MWVELLKRFKYRQLVFVHSSDTDGRALLGRFQTKTQDLQAHEDQEVKVQVGLKQSNQGRSWHASTLTLNPHRHTHSTPQCSVFRNTFPSKIECLFVLICTACTGQNKTNIHTSIFKGVNISTFLPLWNIYVTFFLSHPWSHPNHG